jgi:flagellar basal body-associated protein FliL
MAARLSGRPSPRRKSPEEAEEPTPSPVSGKPPRQNMLLISALTIALAVAALSTAGLVFVTMNPGSVKSSEKTEHQAEFAAGPMIELGQFTVNLGDVNQRRFLRTSLTLSFTTSDKAYLAGNEQKKATFIEELKHQFKEKQPIFQDIVVSTLSAKSAEALGTLQGKAELKAELTTRLNQFLEKETHVRDVLITEFIIQ